MRGKADIVCWGKGGRNGAQPYARQIHVDRDGTKPQAYPLPPLVLFSVVVVPGIVTAELELGVAEEFVRLLGCLGCVLEGLDLELQPRCAQLQLADLQVEGRGAALEAAVGLVLFGAAEELWLPGGRGDVVVVEEVHAEDAAPGEREQGLADCVEDAQHESDLMLDELRCVFGLFGREWGGNGTGASYENT